MNNLVENTIDELSVSIILEVKHKVAFRKLVKEENANHMYLFKNGDLLKIQALYFHYLGNFNFSEKDKAFEFYKIIFNSDSNIKSKFPLTVVTELYTCTPFSAKRPKEASGKIFNKRL